MNHETLIKSLGLKLKTLRKARGFSQEQLAEMIDKSVDTISNIERGKFSTSLDTAIDLAKVLNVEVYELFMTHDIKTTDKTKMTLIAEIIDQLHDQPEEILQFTLEQTKQIVSLKEQFIDKLRG